MNLIRLFITCLICVTMLISRAYGSIQIGATRVIYHANEKNISVNITNPGDYPVLLQSWIDEGNPEIKPDTVRSPFILTPPLTPVNGGSGQTLRLAYTGTPLPADRESIYWLNVLEIPPVRAKKDNRIQVAFRSRIKLFYRPTALDDAGAQSAISQLRWRAQGDRIVIINPSPYYVSAVTLSVKSRGGIYPIAATMLSPLDSSEFTLPAGFRAEDASGVSVDAINDYGAPVNAPVSHQ